MQENYSDTLDLYIALAFEFLDGEIETYDEPSGGGYGAYSKKYIDGYATLYTDKGTEYTIRLDGYYRYDEYPNETGLFYVVLANQTLYKELEAEGLNASALTKDTSWKVPIG